MNIFKKILKGFVICFCGAGILVYTSMLIHSLKESEGPEQGALRVVLIVLDIALVGLLYLLLQKKKPYNNKAGADISTPTSKFASTVSSTHSAETLPTVSEEPQGMPDVSAVQYRTPDGSNASLNVLQGTFRHIPQEIIDLLWFINGPLKNYTVNQNIWTFDLGGASVTFQSIMTQEPSAIDTSLPIHSHLVNCAPLGYYPSYQALTPEQRTIYLNWLTDITAPIDIGYVFIFYYGLERHLFFGEKEAALTTILVLREFHTNGSFLAYSGNALMLYALLNDRPDIARRTEINQISTDLQLFSAALLRHSLTSAEIMVAHKKFSFENSRYIKGHPELFQSTLEELLTNRYGSNILPITLEDLQAAKGTFTLALANYSLLPEQRFLALPDVSSSAKVHSAVNALLTETHEIVKSKLREMRKKPTA